MNEVDSFDAVVVGSGFGGAVTACRLAGAGLSICILERGRRYEPSDLPVLPEETFWPAVDGLGERKVPDFGRAFWKLGQGLWDIRDLGDLVVGQAAGFGGGSLIYANVHLRAPDDVFEDWPQPISGPVLARYYDLAAYMLDVQQPPKRLPKSVALERVAERLVPERLSAHFVPPLAVNFDGVKKNRFGLEQGACDMRGECWIGCKQQAKNTLDLNYLAAAETRGAEVRTLAEVSSIRRRDGDLRYEVHYRNHLKRGSPEVVHARYVFLCAGAVNTTELLMCSRQGHERHGGGGNLPIEGTGLGTKFYPNVDELAVVFNCDEEQEADRGPTITSSFLYDDGESWLLIQDGGLPTHLQPFLGLFRSPLWMHRNGYAKVGAFGSDGDNVALPQRVGYAELPVESIVDVLAELSGSAVAAMPPLAHDVSRTWLDLARQQPTLLRQLLEAPPADKQWALCPDQLSGALERIRKSILADVAIASEPFVETLIQRAATRLPGGLLESLGDMTGRFDVANVSEEELRRWALRLAVQSLWGSQAGLLGAIANLFDPFVDPQEMLVRGVDFLKWALDYRAGDGHAAVLLTFGRDQQPSTLEIVSDRVAVGTAIRGKESKAEGVVVLATNGTLALADVHGEFDEGEVVLADSRPLGICAGYRLQDFSFDLGGGSTSEKAANSTSFGVLSVHRGDAADARRFRSDSYRLGNWETARAPAKAGASLRARSPAARDTPERGKQELLLRDVARELKGELRTAPLWPFFGRRLTVHSQGGCAMADGPDQGVTDVSGEVFGCAGLYVMDAAAFPTPVGVNPSATIAAVAEWKIEQFLRNEEGIASLLRGETGEERATWAASEMEEAIRWAESRRQFLDPLGGRQRAARGSAPPRAKHRPIGIEFQEVMKGTHRAYDGPEKRTGGTKLGPELAIQTELAVSVDDLSNFLAADREGDPRPLRVEGKILITWEEGDVPTVYEVLSDGSHLKILAGADECGNPTRSLEYRLRFAVPDRDHIRPPGTSRVHVLDGVKDIRDDARFDVWEDTTTLTFLLKQEMEADPVECVTYGWGVLRLAAADFFGDQLRSFRATNSEGDPARQAWALATFGRFFFGHLVDVYLPSLSRVADIGRHVLGKGHV
jgi:choline dehydrogenase-like flavoprotein